MANCEEQSCENVQSAVCLHCNRRLCTTHVIAHGTALLQEAEKLSEQINELAEHLNVSLEQIQSTHSETMKALGNWRERQIAKIEDKYAEKVQSIGSRQDYLIELEKQLSQRLAKDAREPLERMQLQKSANNELIQHVCQTISDIKQKSKELAWKPIQSVNPSSSMDIDNTAINTPHQYQQLQTHDQRRNENMFSGYYPPYQQNNLSVGNHPSFMQVISPVNTVTNVPPPLMNQSGIPPQFVPQYGFNQNGALPVPYWVQPATTSAPPVYQMWTPRPAMTVPQFAPPPQKPIVSTGSQTDIKRIPTNSSEKLRNLFMNVSGSGDQQLNNFIIHNLSRAVHINNMMVLLLSFLEAWHPKNSPNVFNERILSYHIFTIKKYINGRDHELTVIGAIIAFISSCGHDETRSSQLMNNLLQFFYDHKCITKATVLDWYENGASYGYTNFEKAKLWAKLFIDHLKTHIQ